MARRTSSGGSAIFYNLVTTFMMLLSAVVACGVGFLGLNAPAPPVSGIEPTLFVFPSRTPTLQGPTPNATLTITATLTGEPSATPTREPTLTRTPTITPTPVESYTPTVTNTPVVTATFTPTVTNTPAPVTPSLTPTATVFYPFNYILRNNAVTYTQNFANSAGCNWASIAGQVLSISNTPQTGIRIHVFGLGIDQVVSSGSATQYGASGWEVKVGDTPSSEIFRVQVEDAAGAPLSELVNVQMLNTCERNVAIVNWQQVK
ncbi:MAG: hypothetical protein IT326_08900 [Anaerolineae bacterium]|nr:hypothetical protein [Anaerolineae bacterium]